MSKKFWLIVPAVWALCSPYLHAQPRTLGLDEMFRLADENSVSLQTYATGREAAAEAVRTARLRRLPDVSASVSASYLGNGRIWDRDFSGSTRVPMPHFGNNFALEAQQVVYAGGAVSSGIRLAELDAELAGLDWEKNRQDVRFQLLGAYLELFKLDNQTRVLERNLDLARQVLADMRARYGQGTVLKNDITRYELQQEDLQLQLARVSDARTVVNHRMVTVLHLPDSTVIVPDSAVLADEVKALGQDAWQQTAARTNLDLRRAATGIEVNRQLVRQVRSERLPQVALVAADHLDGPVTIEVPALDNNFNYWYVGVSLRYNLSSLFKGGHKLKQARLNVRQAEERQALAREQVENAVQAAYTDFLTAFTELRTQEKSVQLADENYAVTSNRYRNELALLTDMLDAGNTKLSADLALVNARVDLVYHYYKMKYVSHTL